MGAAELNIYTTREPALIQPLLDAFTTDSGIKVNTIHPGYVRTDMNKVGDEQSGELEVADGAKTSVRLALIDDDGPTGGYFYLDQVLPW